MTYDLWLSSVPSCITGDMLWKLEAYRFALFASDIAWRDVSKLVEDRRTASLADQLYRAIGSIGANIAEGYSRRSGKDQARMHEYSLGSARESRHWYYKARHVLGEPVALHRMDLLTRIIRILLTMVPAERETELKEDGVPYTTMGSALTESIPFA